MSLEWRIYYGDGSTYDGPLESAPVVNVQVIVVNDKAPNRKNVGRLMLFGFDYYLYREKEGWYGINGEVDLVDHLLYEQPLKVLKGRGISSENYSKIYNKANLDSDFPKKRRYDPARENK